MPRELELLKALLEAKGRALGRGYLLETLWGRDQKVGIDSRTLDVHVRSLRNKLGREGQRILTVRKVGYRVDTSSVALEQRPVPGTLPALPSPPFIKRLPRSHVQLTRLESLLL